MFVALSIRNSSFATDGDGCPRKRESYTDARDGRETDTESGARHASATESAGSQSFLKSPTRCSHGTRRPAQGKWFSTRTGRSPSARDASGPGRSIRRADALLASVRREPPPTAARGATSFTLSVELAEPRQESRGAHPVLRGVDSGTWGGFSLRIVRWDGERHRTRAFPCPGAHDASRKGAQILV